MNPGELAVIVGIFAFVGTLAFAHWWMSEGLPALRARKRARRSMREEFDAFDRWRQAQ